MKRKNKVLLLLLLLILSFLFGVSSYGASQDIYVVPIKGEISNATYTYLNTELSRIEKKEPKAVIFEIDTYGGRIDRAEDIRNRIMDLKCRSISFVNTKAESAGVLITIASENVVMSSKGSIGSAETVPNTEKVMSLWRSFLKDTAEQRGRDVNIILAMADSDIEIEGLVDKGKLLNLNSREAYKYELSDLIGDTYEDIVEGFSLGESNIIVLEETKQVKLAKILSNELIVALLLTLGFLGFVIEIFTPGFGIGASMSILGFSLYFGGNIMSGNGHWISLVLFVAGSLLLVIEGFVPGFGLPGISGLALLLIGIVVAVDSVSLALYSISIALFISIVIGYILIKMGYKSKLFNKTVLKENINSVSGYKDLAELDLKDKKGIVETDLRPVGFIRVDDKKYDAISIDGYVKAGTEIQVERTEGSKIYVRRI